MKPRDYALVAAICVAWGLNNVAVKLSVEGFEPLAAGALRFAILLAACMPWLRVVPGRMRPILIVAALQGPIHFGLLNLAWDAADNIAALSIIMQLGTPITLVLAVLFHGERVRLVRTLAVVAAMGGVALIGFDPSVFDERAGIALTLAATLAYAAALMLLRGMPGVHPFNILGWLALLATPGLAAASWIAEPGALAAAGGAPAAAWGAVAYSALFSSLLGHGGVNWLLQRHPVSVVTPLFVPAPVLGAAAAVWYYDLPVTWRLVAGGLVVTAAVAVIAFRTGGQVMAVTK